MWPAWRGIVRSRLGKATISLAVPLIEIDWVVFFPPKAGILLFGFELHLGSMGESGLSPEVKGGGGVWW